MKIDGIYILCLVMYNFHSHLVILTVALLNGVDEVLRICFDPLMKI